MADKERPANRHGHGPERQQGHRPVNRPEPELEGRQGPEPLSRQERRRQQRRQDVARQQQQQRRSARRWYLGGGIVAVVLLVGGGAVFAINNGNNGGNTVAAGQPGSSIDGITCEAEMLSYHIHAHLTLYQNGQPVVVPAYVGIPASTAINVGGQNSCLYYLHTHDPSGIVHIESPTAKLYTLGQFFDIWHYTSQWDAQGGLGLSVDSAYVNALQKARPSDIHVYVNGKPVGSDYRSVTFTAHKLITVELGTPLKAPETHYNFNGI